MQGCEYMQGKTSTGCRGEQNTKCRHVKLRFSALNSSPSKIFCGGDNWGLGERECGGNRWVARELDFYHFLTKYLLEILFSIRHSKISRNGAVQGPLSRSGKIP
jgi:hypothetical protein